MAELMYWTLLDCTGECINCLTYRGFNTHLSCSFVSCDSSHVFLPRCSTASSIVQTCE